MTEKQAAEARTITTETIITIIATWLPWLAPVYTIYLVVSHLLHQQVPWPIAAVVGVVIEALGIIVVFTVIEIYTYNTNKLKSDQHAVMWPALVVSVIYFGIVIAVTVMRPVPAEQKILDGTLAGLSAVSAVLIGLRVLFERTKLENAEAGLKRRAARAGISATALTLAQLEKETGVSAERLQALSEENTSQKPAPKARSVPTNGQNHTAGQTHGQTVKVRTMPRVMPSGRKAGVK